MNTCCYQPTGTRVVPQTRLATEQQVRASLSTAEYLFPVLHNELFEGLQVERYVLQRTEAALQRVAAFAPDWDGAGSPPPSRHAVSNASAALPEIYRVCCASDAAWRSPHVSANESGEVSFEWWNGPRKLTMYFGDDFMQVIKVWGIHLYDEMDVLPLINADEFEPLWVWLHGRC